jgi:phosphatidylinositol kinase/protein kinase (PI-3  family)
MFMRSCAGYCIATFVLGIGDRHNDNIMLRHDGRLFHIDFGHFLGHFLKKFGIERETAPFVFTPQFAHVLGGEDSPQYKFFESLCILAFTTVRHNANVFINLILLMLSIGLPELQRVEDVMWLRDHLMLGLNDTDAAIALCQLTRQSLKTTRVQLNDLFHLLANR